MDLTPGSTPYENAENTLVAGIPSWKYLPFFFFFFSIWLDVPHLTNEHRTQDCIAS